MLDGDISPNHCYCSVELKPLLGSELMMRTRSLQIAQGLQILKPKSALSTSKFQKWILEWLWKLKRCLSKTLRRCKTQLQLGQLTEVNALTIGYCLPRNKQWLCLVRRDAEAETGPKRLQHIVSVLRISLVVGKSPQRNSGKPVCWQIYYPNKEADEATTSVFPLRSKYDEKNLQCKT